MPDNKNLQKSKDRKYDEFYTQYDDIAVEINSYFDYDKNVFKDKTVFCPCDDYRKSNFTKFFIDNFDKFGLKKLISTAYNGNSKLFSSTENTKGILYIKERGKTEYKGYLKGNGDFRSDEIRETASESDFIITNPPFSISKYFFEFLIKTGKKFSIIGNINMITYNSIFYHIKDGSVTLGATNFNKKMLFEVTDEFTPFGMNKKLNKNGKIYGYVSGICWFTNIEFKHIYIDLPLHTMQENIKSGKFKKLNEYGYLHFDNYNAIDVPYTKAIPSDYDGMMGVPVSFMKYYSPLKFRILDRCSTMNKFHLKTKIYTAEEERKIYFDRFGKKGITNANKSGVVKINGLYYMTFDRILIEKVKKG